MTGRRALVTGAGRGVGRGIAAALAARGASVAVNDLAPARAEDAAAELRDVGATAVAVAFDVTDGTQVDQGVARAAEALGGPVDVLVNNAGVPEGMRLVHFRDAGPEDWRRCAELNLDGAMNCVRAVVEPMVRQGWGRIVQISSGAGRTGVPFGVSLYGASKSGIEGFVRHLSQELAPTGVTANTVALGLMDNAVPDGSTEEALSALAASVPVGRLGRPQDAAAAVVWLASDEAGWVTGQTVGVNGGSTTL